MLQTIISGLIVAVLGGLILHLVLRHFFGVGKPNSEKKNVLNIASKKYTASNRTKSIDYTPGPANKDPEAIVLRIKQEKNLLLKEKIAETYVKLPISWKLILATVSRDKNKKNQKLIILKTEHSATYVTCWVDLEKYPDLKFAHEGSLIFAEGIISDVDNYANITITKPKIKIID